MTRSAPVMAEPSLVSRHTANEPGPLRALWDSSWGKAVGEVTTILGTDPLPAGLPSGEGHPDLVGRVDATAVGRTVDLAVDEHERLAVAGSVAVRTRRIAAIDRYALHRAYPSPRALFGVDLEHRHPDGRRSILTPWDGAVLEATVPTQRPAAGESSGATPARGTGDRRAADVAGLVALATPGRYPSPYGDLRPTLTLLEAGHLLATVLAVAHHVDVQPTTVLGGWDGVAGRMTLGACVEEGLELPVASATRLVDTATAGTDVRSVGDWFARRTSGPSGANLITSGEPTADVIARLDEVVALGLELAAASCPPGALTVHRTILRGRGMTDRTVAQVHPVGPGTTSALAARAPWSSALGYTWSIDPLVWEREHAAVGNGAVQVLLGWLCQWVCLAAAALGVAARPMRNIDEALWASDLQLESRAMPAYQVWIRPLLPHDRTPSAWTNQGRAA